ncbi:Unknown protein sequence [Pseudomonas syringae pv. maculicola str. M6]|nr:Unknown protein sequence [Pseudomonas syringae pv. maculicola str. M6]
MPVYASGLSLAFGQMSAGAILSTVNVFFQPRPLSMLAFQMALPSPLG